MSFLRKADSTVRRKRRNIATQLLLSLNVSDTVITDVALHSIKVLRNLRCLNVSFCANITNRGLCYCTSAFFHLQELSLVHTGISDEGLSSLHWCAKLRSLDVRYCRGISNASILLLESLKHLQELRVGFCGGVTDEGLSYIGMHHRFLTHLDVSGCDKISTTSVLATLKHLRILRLRNCSMSNDSIASLEGLADVLVELDISFCSNITGRGLARIADTFPHLRYLSMDWCEGITDEGLEHVGKLKRLVSVSMAACSAITDEGLLHLAPCGQLECLVIRNCRKITNGGLSFICQHLGKLQFLDISGCLRITDDGIESLQNLQLQQFKMQYCSKITEVGIALAKTYTVGDVDA